MLHGATTIRSSAASVDRVDTCKWIKLTSTPTAAATSIPLFERRDELDRIIHSRHFANAPKKTRFLQFVAEQAFHGNGDKLNEYLIGVEVYDRGSEFNPQKDPIVRVQAYEIRRLLKKYYEEEGKNSPIQMNLPPGHYVPVFEQRSVEQSAVSSQAKQQMVPPRNVNRLLAASVLFFAVVSVVLAFVLLFRSFSKEVGKTGRSLAVPDALAWFWQPFLAQSGPPLIVIPNHPLLRAAHAGDTPQTVAKGHEIPKSELPDFRDTIHFHELKRFVFVPSLTDFTSVGETLAVVNLCEMFWNAGRKCRVQQSRLVSLEDIKGENAILLGGNQPWSGRVYVNPEGFQFKGGVILNSKPVQNEQTVYKPEFDLVTNQLRRDYALILALPNERSENRVLVVYGIYTQGSQAAVKYLTNPERMQELRSALIASSPDHKSVPPYFQALLTTTVENSVPGNVSLVAVRTITK